MSTPFRTNILSASDGIINSISASNINVTGSIVSLNAQINVLSASIAVITGSLTASNAVITTQNSNAITALFLTSSNILLSGNINAGNNKITNLSAGIVSGDSVRYDEFVITQTSASNALPTASLIVTDAWQSLSTAQATAAIDFTSVSRNKKIAVTGNFTLATPTAPPDGALVSLLFVQNNAGGNEILFPSSFVLATGIKHEANSETLIQMRYDATNVKYIPVSARERTKIITGTLYTLTNQDHNTLLICTSTSSATITAIPISGSRDYTFAILQDNSGTITFAATGTDTIGNNLTSSLTTNTLGSVMSFIAGPSTNWRQI